MSIQEQQDLKEKYYTEAVRYMDNAKECLKKARKEGKYYMDVKYVRSACGIAYSGVLVALDGLFRVKELHKPKARKSIEYYQETVGKFDKKLLVHLNVAYNILHLSGYYDGNQKVDVVMSGFDEAYTIIEKIKPQGI